MSGIDLRVLQLMHRSMRSRLKSRFTISDVCTDAQWHQSQRDVTASSSNSVILVLFACVQLQLTHALYRPFIDSLLERTDVPYSRNPWHPSMNPGVRAGFSIGRGRIDMLENGATLIAYIDPGSGSLLLQFVIAACVGSAIALRQRFGAMASWIRQKATAWRS